MKTSSPAPTRVLWDDVPPVVKAALAARADVKLGGTAIVDVLSDGAVATWDAPFASRSERWYFRKTQFGWNNLSVDRAVTDVERVAADLTPAQREQAEAQVKKVEEAMAATAATAGAGAVVAGIDSDTAVRHRIMCPAALSGRSESCTCGASAQQPDLFKTALNRAHGVAAPPIRRPDIWTAGQIKVVAGGVLRWTRQYAVGQRVRVETANSEQEGTVQEISEYPMQGRGEITVILDSH